MFKFKATSKWYKTMAKVEGGHDISAGLPFVELETLQNEDEVVQEVDKGVANHSKENYKIEFRQAGYSKFMHKLRIKAGLSIEQLADEIDVDQEQLLLIEQRIGYKAPPRTLSRLADYYGLPLVGFLQLAGAVKKIDRQIEEDVVRFAAESDSFEKLSYDEKCLLNNLVKVIRDFSQKKVDERKLNAK